MFHLLVFLAFSLFACKEEPAQPLGLSGDSQGLTLFDKLIAQNDGKIPYPFEKLVEHLSQRGDPVQVLVPLGRSLQRHEHGDKPFSDPRRLGGICQKKCCEL